MSSPAVDTARTMLPTVHAVIARHTTMRSAAAAAAAAATRLTRTVTLTHSVARASSCRRAICSHAANHSTSTGTAAAAASTTATSTPAAPSASASASPSASPSAPPPKKPELILSPVYGLPVRADLPEYTYEEVYTHDRPDSYWIVLDSHVYDITRYAARHPGGGIEETFARGHGTDVGAAFDAVHSWKEKRITASCLIGRIKPGSVSNRVAKPRPVVTSLELDDEPLTEVAFPAKTASAPAPSPADSSTSSSSSSKS